MGEAKRRGKAAPPHQADLITGFNDAERQALERLRMGAYRHASTAITRARTHASPEQQRDEIALVHRDAARVLDTATETFFRTSRDGPGIEKKIACRKGCSFCCWVNVEVTIIEAIGVAAAVQNDATLRAAVMTTAPKLAGLDPYARIRARVPCALLGADGGCSIYNDRPRNCRAYTSYDAKRCEDELTDPNAKREKMLVFTWPRILASAATVGLHKACDDAGLQRCTVELTDGVATILAEPNVIARWLTGEAVFKPYVPLPPARSTDVAERREGVE